MSISVKCNVKDMQRSYIPNVHIAEMDCGDVHIKMDIHEEVRTFNPGDNVAVVISKDMPSYREGVDYVANGYVVAFRDLENSRKKMIVSLWGFIVVVEAPSEFLTEFNPMDKVYMKISKE